MKIAMVFFDLSIPAGGQRQFLSLARELKNKGHNVKIFTCLQDKNIYPELWNDLEVKVVKPKYTETIKQKIFYFNKNYYAYINKAEAIYKEMDNDFDVLNCHEDFAYRVGYYYKKNKPNTKVVWSLNNVCYYYDNTGNIFKKIKSYLLNVYKNFRDKKYYKCVDIVAPLSKYEEKWCQDRNLKVQIVRSGLDFQKFYKKVKTIENVSPINILSVGALGSHRRFEDVIHSIKILRDEGFNLNANIICKKINGFHVDSYEKTIKEMISNLKLEKEIKLITEGVDDKELANIYDECHIFVHTVYLPPPQYYGWGLVVFEAMASGLPVVLCNTTGATEVLTDGVNAIFSKPLDSKSFSVGIKKLLSNSKYYRYVAQNGQDYVKNNISWEKYTESMIKLFNK